MTQKETNNLNIPIIREGNKLVIKSTHKENPDPDGFTAEFCQTFKEYFTNASQKKSRVGNASHIIL